MRIHLRAASGYGYIKHIYTRFVCLSLDDPSKQDLDGERHGQILRSAKFTATARACICKRGVPSLFGTLRQRCRTDAGKHLREHHSKVYAQRRSDTRLPNYHSTCLPFPSKQTSIADMVKRKALVDPVTPAAPTVKKTSIVCDTTPKSLRDGIVCTKSA